MEKNLSPLERSRQILLEMEQEEASKQKASTQSAQKGKKTRTKQAAARKEPTIEDNSADEFTDEMESSPIYSEEIGSTNSMIKLDHESILQGIILSEVLQKPKSLKRGRW